MLVFIAVDLLPPSIQSEPIPLTIDQCPLSGVTVGGYSGLFRMPTTVVTPDGWMQFSVSGGPWSRQTNTANYVPQASLNYSGIVGLLPNMEIGASFLTPSLFNGNIADRAIGVKWAIRPERPRSYSIAIGTTDLHGTMRRATDYVVAGQDLGKLRIFGGYGRGLVGGPMAGASYTPTRTLALMAEDVSGDALIGAKLQPLKRVTLAAATDRHGVPFWGIGYSVPLRSPDTAIPSKPDEGNLLKGLAKRLSQLGRGRAEANISADRVAASYDDVEGRDPVRNLGKALRLCVETGAGFGKELSLTVRRFGFDLVTLSGPIKDIRSFLNGWETTDDFLKVVRIEDAGGRHDASTEGNSEATGHSPDLLVSLTPGIAYSLGLVDNLPNKEFIQADGIAKLPANLLLKTGTSVNVNNALDDSTIIQPVTVALYRTDRIAPGVWTMAGIDRDFREPWAATLQAAYFVPTLPLQLQGSVSQPMQESISSSDRRFSAEASIDLMSGNLSLFARRERFLAGDIGNTLGLTRRFGQTWLTLEYIDTRLDDIHVQRVGIVLRVPLPDEAVNLGPVRVATSATAQFSYLESPTDKPNQGLGAMRQPLLSPSKDLTASGQLTSAFIRLRVESLRTP